MLTRHFLLLLLLPLTAAQSGQGPLHLLLVLLPLTASQSGQGPSDDPKSYAAKAHRALAEDDPPSHTDDETGLKELEGALLSDTEVEDLIVSYAKMRQKHVTKSALFTQYNRFQDASKETGEQGLGNQEVRALLKDLGLGNLALRGEMAKLAISATDASGDGKVSEKEFDAALALVDCWIGYLTNPEAADTPSGRDAILTPSRRLAERLDKLAKEQSLAAAAEIVREELHSCAAGIQSWWTTGGWAKRLRAEEAKSVVIKEDLKEKDPISEIGSYRACTVKLLTRLFQFARRPTGERGGKEIIFAYLNEGGDDLIATRGNIRKALKLAGIDSLLIRHLIASKIIEELDRHPKDKHLNINEIRHEFMLACRLYDAIEARGTSLTAIARAATLPAPNGFSLDQLMVALQKGTDKRNKLAREAADTTGQHKKLDPMTMTALAEAYVELVPDRALGKGKEEL